ncbi:Threonine aldolase [Dissophora globulifera]|uniref:Threonine aldolase n=1 Tax=Dissophora globulifera TaxID=979702 RepID=A0A9P6R1A1_9FUNG|nr:Threonine aldolase [Dissophora globulifera]
MSTSPSVNPLPYSDFRSDTATAPTPDMFAAMMKSSLCDDVYNEDDSCKKLERYVATLCGHEAALFCSSGTMTNQLAHRAHLCNPPQSAVVDIRSHVFNYEAGGISFHSQAAVYPIMPANGKYLTVEDIAPRLVFDVDVHFAPTRVVSLENTLNGTIMPLEEIVRIRELTRQHDIKLHLDGARLWHASIATGISLKEYCSHFDTVSLCLSKGIGAPIGSILVGSEATIKKARHFRLLFGGGWRQAGLLAEAALWAIKNNWPTMEETHMRAKWLERVFVDIGCSITNPVDTNMIWVDTTEAGFTVEELCAELAKENIKISGSGYAARVVLHYQITNEAVQKFVDVLHRLSKTHRTNVNVDLIRAVDQVKKEKEDELLTRSTYVASKAPVAPLTPTTPTSPGYPTEEVTNRCLFEGTEEVAPVEVINLAKPEFRKPRRVVSEMIHDDSPSSQFSAHTPMNHRTEHQSMMFLDRRSQEQRDEEGSDGTTTPPLMSNLARSKSLDLQRIEIAAPLISESINSTEYKKKKLGYLMSHNPAGKALKRASNRIARWSGSLLTKEA